MNYPIKSSLGKYQSGVDTLIAKFVKTNAVQRIWDKDASLWKSDPAVQATILNRLGWLNIGVSMVSSLGEITQFAGQVQSEGIKYALLLGMGGSSLCPEVLANTFGNASGYPELLVLDSTDPVQVLATEQKIDLTKTIFIVSSKSGGTIEPNSMLSYFWDRAKAALGKDPGERFVAITDPGSSLEQLAKDQKFLKIFYGAADVGGRFSALSRFGLVPGALMGMRVGVLLERGGDMASMCAGIHLGADNPGLYLGAAMGYLATQGRDKMTLISSPEVGAIGVWVEQLIAESTGKEGKGILPVDGESIGTPEVYGDDRWFVYLRVEDSDDSQLDAKVNGLEKAGFPVITISLSDTLDLGAQFFLWEFATAVCGLALDVNPFDEPNVKESKDWTQKLLTQYYQTGEIAKESAEPVSVYQTTIPQVKLAIEQLMEQAKQGDYISISAFVERNPANDKILTEFRNLLRDKYKVATTVGFGPRFLHSTGQLFKGGSNNILVVHITADDPEDVQVPGEKFTFGVLKNAQAMGDLYALVNRKRRCARFQLGSQREEGLSLMLSALKS